MTRSLSVLLCVFLSATLIYSTAVTSNFEVDGKPDDWDSAKVASTFSKGTPYNQINMQSTGLHAFACANQITFCPIDQPWIGSLRTLSPFESTVSILGSLRLPGRASNSAKALGRCDARRGVATKSFIFPAVVSQAGNLRVTSVAASPLPYESTEIVPVEQFTTGRSFKLTFSKTFPATTEWAAIPTAASTRLPDCASALPGRGFVCPSGVFYYKKFGIVFLSGLFLSQDPSSATRTNPIFATLPAEARPQYDNDYVVTCDTNSIGYVTVKTTGEVTFRGRATKWCSLDGVSYLFASEIPAAGSQSTASFNLRFGSLFRSPAADSRSPVIAITKDFGLQFLTPFQNGVGTTLASLTTPLGSCESAVEINFPVVIDSQLAFARSVAQGGTLTFSLESDGVLSTPSSGFYRAFAAHNNETGTFSLLLQGYDASSPLFTVTFTFTNKNGGLIAAAIYTPLTKLFTVQNGQASLSGQSAYSAPFFELAFTEPSLVQAGNKVQVAFAFDSFTYSF
eukprot:TRINITY_DN1380_c0_g1_i1.p1 TRINITY_DN1380_c0_g1~~TRINITY_DN1380_c0_g1_i1.p1  ORF type:complete len:510 (-),score=169.22 TRINITY_DN1380_c0_g1_i1:142-1671(-)